MERDNAQRGKILQKNKSKMISYELVEWIVPNLKMELSQREQKYMEDMFTECYWFEDENGKDIVALKPIEGHYLCLCFYILNGAYAYMESWDLVKQRGKLL